MWWWKGSDKYIRPHIYLHIYIYTPTYLIGSAQARRVRHLGEALVRDVEPRHVHVVLCGGSMAVFDR